MPVMFAIVFVAFMLIAVLPITILTIVAWWKICTKAGFSGWLSLLILVPVANIIMPLIVAFMDWPVHKELRQYRQSQGAGNQPGAC